MADAGWNAISVALRSEYRRRLLVNLLDHNPQDDDVPLPESGDVGDRNLEVLRAAMTHNHLPRLESLGYIRWERDGHRVVKGPKFGEIRPLLELLHEHRDELPDGWV